MIDYLIRSGICLTVLLAFYQLFLEREKMHRFNRFYLLFSLVFGLLAPLVTITVPAETSFYTAPSINEVFVETVPEHVIKPVGSISNETPGAVSYNTPEAKSEVDLQMYLIFFYGLVTGILLTRFTGNLIKISSRILHSPTLPLDNASLVLLKEEELPHSFLRYIFVNGEDYKNQTIEKQLFVHELTHVKQRHSLDIFFIEILKIIFWFNPIFILYKRAIQLNHEFLADEAVVKEHDVSDYQYLLLEKSVFIKSIPLASNLNYSITKKRLNMMIKTTSQLKIWTARLAVVPVMVTMLFFVSIKAVSGDAPQLNSKTRKRIPESQTKDPDYSKKEGYLKFVQYAIKEIYFKGATIWIENSEGKYMPHKYGNMSVSEKASLPAAPQIPAKSPTNEILVLWKTKPDTYGVWLDGKRIKNSELVNYKPADFPLYSSSKLEKNAKNYGNHYYQIELYTKPYFTKTFVEPNYKYGKWIAVYKGKIWPGYMDGGSMIRAYFEFVKNGKKPDNKGHYPALPPFKPEPIDY